MTKEKEQKEKMKPLDMLLQMTGMIQYMANAMNIEAAGIIHSGGWCKELITSECPICKMEAEQDGNEDAKQ